MPPTSRRTWQKAEGRAAADFKAKRQPGSGSSGRDDQTSSDSTHPRIYLECKLRESHAVVNLWDSAKKKGHKEGKDPLVALFVKSRPGKWYLLHDADIPAMIANWLAAREPDEVADILAAAERYRQADSQ